jgi:uncharacterized protein YbbC (DUF1343 family)
MAFVTFAFALVVSTTWRPRSAENVARPPTLAGVDVLDANGFKSLRGRHVGLLTNHTGQSREGVSTIDLLAHAEGVTLVALFSPEHGIRGELDALVSSSRDDRTGLPVHSLYGETRRPTMAMLAGLDVLVVDLQDIGSRFYTYPATVAYVMEEAAKHKVAVIVLDRPNPIGGIDVEGPRQDSDVPRFTGYLPMPIRHGLTIGELARVFNGERRLGVDLMVIAMKDWRRDQWFDDTRLPWVNPSPNIRNLTAAALYPGLGAIEGTNLSVGRGTGSPFQQVGAPWVDADELADRLNARQLAGITFSPITFVPSAGAKLGTQSCHGVFMTVTDRKALRPVRLGVEIASALFALYGDRFRLQDALTLFGSAGTLQQIRAGVDPAVITDSWKDDEARWRAVRAKYLLY